MIFAGLLTYWLSTNPGITGRTEFIVFVVTTLSVWMYRL